MIYSLVLAIAVAPPMRNPEAAFQRLQKEFWAATGRQLDFAVVKKYAPRYFAHAERFPKDPSAIEALLHLASVSYTKTEIHQKAMEKLEKQYVRSSVVLPMLRALGMSTGTINKQFIRSVAEKNPDKRIRALAWRAVLNGRMSYVQVYDSYLARPEVKKKLDATTIAWYKTELATLKKDIAEARQKLQSKDLAGVLADVSIGAKAPATAAIDLSGKKVSLADHKGKVIVLDFWYVRCRPCREMIPSMNALVKEMKGRPFVSIAVSVDASKDDVIAFRKTTQMLGESWWVGRNSPAQETWDVEAYPTVYVIDHEGVIRHHQIGYDARTDKVCDLVRNLVKKAEAAGR